MSLAVKVENLSKAYQIGEFSTGTLSRDIERWWALTRGKEDPFLMVGETNVRSVVGTSNVVWSLRDLNFEVEKGEAIGIIGKNGAGKSTLLKLLSQVTSPTTGIIKMKGKAASLLEVGTGFHPELTGRENIFLNGAILGMTKPEVIKKFDEIVDFSGVDRYIDTPVKRYSSGMYVRLAFAVAAHLESDILIVDEVLAVGDSEFQKKCVGKMDEISKGDGRTILFVSHNMSSVQKLCKKSMLLIDGSIALTGETSEIIEEYESYSSEGLSCTFSRNRPEPKKEIELLKASISNDSGDIKEFFNISETILINLEFECRKNVQTAFGYLIVRNLRGETIIESDSHDLPPNILENLDLGVNRFKLEVRPFILAHGEYIVYLSLGRVDSINPHIDIAGEILRFKVADRITNRGSSRNSKTSYLIDWELQ